MKKKKGPVLPDCSKCDGQCCHYIAIQIDGPTNRKTYDNIRWFLVHKKTAVFVDGKNWFVQVFNSCRHLSKNSLCKIYETRPQICRDYGKDISTESCFDSPESHDLYFKNAEALENHISRMGLPWNRKT
ncbi:MAG: YkgJ family cysteine cluster protein [Fibrobacteres bacterium]|nr:YkgJ family cysteine cluster protein [Fibrobacterota bacterium]